MDRLLEWLYELEFYELILYFLICVLDFLQFMFFNYIGFDFCSNKVFLKDLVFFLKVYNMGN